MAGALPRPHRRREVRRQRDDRRHAARGVRARTSSSCGTPGSSVVVVHGGGPQINAHLDRLGIEQSFAAGLRVTTPETMDVVRMVLVGQVQREIVGLVNAHGPFAVGLSGEDGRLMTATRRPGRRRRRGGRHRSGRRRRPCRRRRPRRAARRRPGPGRRQRLPRRGRRGLQRQRRHRRRRDRRRRSVPRSSSCSPTSRACTRDWPAQRRGDQSADGARARGPAADAGRGNDPEDGGLPARGPRRRAGRARGRRPGGPRAAARGADRHRASGRWWCRHDAPPTTDLQRRWDAA